MKKLMIACLLLVTGISAYAQKPETKPAPAAKTPELPRFIYGLGIRHVGQQTAIDLAEHFGSVDKLAHATLDELLAVEGIGKVVA